jgi:PEP-CTERM motif-containing protein
MFWKITRLLAVVFVLAFAGLRAEADTVAVGVVSFDNLAQGSGATFGLDIFNATQAGGGSDVTTFLALENLSAVVTFADGSTSKENFAASDGFGDFSTGTLFGAGDVMSAVLTGTFAPLTVTLSDGSKAAIDSTFSTTLTDLAGPLADGDFAYINVNTSPIIAGAPEPGTWGLLLLGIAGVLAMGRKGALTAQCAAKFCFLQ